MLCPELDMNGRESTLPGAKSHSRSCPLLPCCRRWLARENRTLTKSARLDLHPGITEPVVVMISRREVEADDSVNIKRQRAGWSTTYLEKLLGLIAH